MLYKGKKILITGGTGSLGKALTKRFLDLDVDTIRIFSRNENKQFNMESEIRDNRVRYLVGDIRDLSRLTRALEDIDLVFHAAALKHVPVVEYNPFEAIKTNVVGTQNVIDASIEQDVEKIIAIGTDKAVSPLNTYGATKLLMEKLIVTAHNYLNIDKHKTKFIALRYGNVLGSSGSVVPKFIQQIKSKEKITITDPSMTRFSLTMNEALDFILESTIEGKGAEIFVPKLKAYSIMTLKDALQELIENTGHEIINVRQGEKYNEALINNDEIRNTYENDSKYIVFNQAPSEEIIKSKYPNFKKTNLKTSYSSESAEPISKEELKQILIKSNLI